MEANISINDLMDLIQRDIELKIEINGKLDAIMATQAENQAKIDALTTVLEKVVTEVRDLKARYDAGQDLDFSRAEAAANEADQVNEDAAPSPTPETPVLDTNPEA